MIKNSAYNGDELIPKVLRMSSFLPVNVPICVLILLAPPTMKNTIFAQWVGQSYMASLNYQNRNPSCTFTNKDIAKGYGVSLTASISSALALRKMTAGLTKGATGAKLMCLNGAIGAISASIAAYINTQMMRQAEVKNGINVMSSPEMTD